MAGAGVTLEDLKKRLAEFAKERDWDQFHSPRNLLLAMVGEVGELSEIFQWKGEVPRGLPNWKDEEKQHLGEELSDVLLYLVRLSDICGVDLGKAALRKLKMNAIKYPANAGSRGSSEKRTEINTDVDNDAGGDCVKGWSIYSDSSTSNGAGSQGSSEKRTQINTDVDNDVGGDCVTGRSIYSDSSTSNGAGSQGSSEKRTQFNTDVHNDAGGD